MRLGSGVDLTLTWAACYDEARGIPHLIETPPVRPHQPVWPLAELYPYQGEWSESEYLNLQTNRLVEYADGFLEFPPMPTDEHQGIVAFIYEAVARFLRARGKGVARFAPLHLRVAEGRYREPNVLALLDPESALRGSEAWTSADLVVEVVSPSDPERDYATKRREYAAAGIAEYWIVDPDKQIILVLSLDKDSYREVGRFSPGQHAGSLMLSGFALDVREVFAAAHK